MSKPEVPQLVPSLVAVKLLKPHTHADTPLDIGDTLDLLPDQAQWLKDTGVAEILPTATISAK